jgi:TonB family protein
MPGSNWRPSWRGGARVLNFAWIPPTLGLLAPLQDTPPKTTPTLKPRWALRPPYPPKCRAQGEAGTVHALFQVRQDGTVASVRILEAPSEGLADSVQTAILKWAFESFELPQPEQTLQGSIRIVFKLED